MGSSREKADDEAAGLC